MLSLKLLLASLVRASVNAFAPRSGTAVYEPAFILVVVNVDKRLRINLDVFKVAAIITFGIAID